MNPTLSPALRWTQQKYLPWLGGLFGALIASWVIWQSHGIVNRDGLLYIEVARHFSLGEWRQGFALYNWPLYPLMMAGIHQLSGLTLVISAQIITIVAFAISTTGIMVLAREAGGGRNVMLAAGLLFSCANPLVNNYLPMILRDHGALAAHIWSIIYFMRFYRSSAWKHALAWGGLAVLATLFRIELIVYLFLLPMVILAEPSLAWRQRLNALFKAHGLLLGTAVLLGIALLFHAGLDSQHLGRLLDPIREAQMLIQQLSQGLAEKSHTYADEVLGSFLDDYATSGIMLTLAYALLLKAATSAGWIHLGLGMYACKGKTSDKPHATNIFLWLLLLGLIIATAIILTHFLLPKRYLQPIAILIVLYGAFGLVRLHAAWQSRARGSAWSWAFPSVAALLVVHAFITLKPESTATFYDMKAAHWLAEHAAPDSKIFYDDLRLRYYAFGDSTSREELTWPQTREVIKTGEYRNYDFIVIHLSRSHRTDQVWVTEQLGVEPAAMFENGRGRRVLIYQRGSANSR